MYPINSYNYKLSVYNSYKKKKKKAGKQEVHGGGKDAPWGRGGADETVSLVGAELSTQSVIVAGSW